MGKARRDLDEIFTKIYIEFERDIANSLLNELEEKIKSLILILMRMYPIIK